MDETLVDHSVSDKHHTVEHMTSKTSDIFQYRNKRYSQSTLIFIATTPQDYEDRNDQVPVDIRYAKE